MIQPEAPAEPGASSPSVARAALSYLTWLGGWRLAVVLLIEQAGALAVTGLLAPLFGPREPFKGNWNELVGHAGGLVDRILSNWQRWDALWYQHIAQEGYRASDGSAAFLPLYPLLSRLLSSVFAGNVVLAELVVSGLAYVGAMGLLWKLVHLETQRTSGDTGSGPITGRGRALVAPLLTVLLIALYPTGFFLVAPFTESLFLLLAVAAFWFMRTGHPWAAGAAGFLASLTRTQGVFLALPLAHEYLRSRGSIAWLRRRGGRSPGAGIIASALPVAGMLSFALFQANVLGVRRIGVGAQAAWGLEIVAPWDALAASWEYISRDLGRTSAQVEALNLLSLVGFAAIVLAGARRLPLAYTLYAAPSIGLLLFRDMWLSPLMSVSRYVLVVFPCFVAVALWLAPRPRLATAWLVASFFLQLVLYQYWVRWGFVA